MMDDIAKLIHLYAQFRLIGKTYTEYEAFLYENMCITLTKKMKLDDLAIEQSLKQIQEHLNGTDKDTKKDTL